MRLLRLAATALLCIASLVAQAEPRLCVVPVKDGTPADNDINRAWRLLAKVIMLPGVQRPVIYPANRAGAWTIDDTHTFVPFGDVFPSNIDEDRFVRDPGTGRILGLNKILGLFALDRGEHQFRRLYAADANPLKQPGSAAFIPRMNGFVISDATGLHLLDGAGALSPLIVSDRAMLGVPTRVYDLPAFNALLVSATGTRPDALPYAVVRFDDGQLVRGPTFDRNDTITRIDLQPDGTLLLSGGARTYHMEISPRPSIPTAQTESFEIMPERRAVRRDRLEAPSIGKSLAIERRNGLFDVRDGKRKPIELPFDVAKEPVEQAAEMPESKIVLLFTPNAIYALDAAGNVNEIAGSRTVGRTQLSFVQGIIPVRNEMMVLGASALHLVLDTRFAGEEACPR
jgi:hypothetical protein